MKLSILWSSHVTCLPLRLFITLLTLTSIISCTNSRRAFYTEDPKPVVLPEPEDKMSLVSEVQFNDGQTEVHQMAVSNGSLYVTGKPFGFSKWNISGNPEAPSLTFAASDTLTTSFTDIEKFGPWLPDMYATQALAVGAGFAYMSGAAGMSVVNTQNTHLPKEQERYPKWSDDEPKTDERLSYKALWYDKKRKRVVGFKEQDKIYYFSTAYSPSLGFVTSQQLPNNGNVCCVKNLTEFQGKIYVAMGSETHVYQPDSRGILKYTFKIPQFHAQWIVATDRFLYIYHEPSSGDLSNYQTGIYIIDDIGKVRAHIPVQAYVFAVNEGNTHIYLNDDDSSIKIYRIRWDLIPGVIKPEFPF